jgi:ATP-dependent RNA helicase DeaD
MQCNSVGVFILFECTVIGIIRIYFIKKHKFLEDMRIEDLNLRPELTKVLTGMGFSEPTAIQEVCIPLIRQGRDVVGQSKTGSGKTAAFGLPILENIEPGSLQVLILTPTRELCIQVTTALNDFARHLKVRATSVYGGVGIQPQIEAIATSEIVVATPGRMLDHLQRGTINLGGVKFLVLDEADKMFEMGFIDDVEKIISQTPKSRQTLLFSATISTDIRKLIEMHLRDPEYVTGEIYVDKSQLRQVYYDVNTHEKFSILVHLLKNVKGLVLVFCNTKHEVDTVAKNLKLQGVGAMAIHGGLSQNKREFALDSLRKEKIDVLVATDVAARGLDIRNVSHVINYDVPKTSEEYIHRIGRTARAGEIGDAITILAERDHENFSRVLRDSSLDIKKMEKPSFEQVRFVREQRGRSFRSFSRRGNEQRPRRRFSR